MIVNHWNELPDKTYNTAVFCFGAGIQPAERGRYQPSPQGQARALAAADKANYLQESYGFRPILVFSGSSIPVQVPDSDITIAEVMADFAHAMGLNPDIPVIPVTAPWETIGEIGNVRYVVRTMARMGVLVPKVPLYMVSSDYHIPRVRLLAERYLAPYTEEFEFLGAESYLRFREENMNLGDEGTEARRDQFRQIRELSLREIHEEHAIQKEWLLRFAMRLPEGPVERIEDCLMRSAYERRSGEKVG